MPKLTLKPVWFTWLFVSSVVAFVAGLIAILQYCSGGADEIVPNVDQDNALVERMSRATFVEPTTNPMPTPIAWLESRLRQAHTIYDPVQRGVAFFEVARLGVLLGDYYTATRAATLTPLDDDQAGSLEFIIECAIEDKQYGAAQRAAGKIRNSSLRESWKSQVIRAETSDAFGQQPTLPGQTNRELMACMEKFPE